MAYISFQPKDYFKSTLYTGNETARTITVGLQPDLVWTKSRSAGHHGIITDATTGAGKRLRTSVTNAQDTSGASVASFVSTGYTLTDDSTINGNSETNVSFSWKGGGGQGSSNTDGSINTTYTSVNTTSGFSISKFTGTGSTATVGHGLGVAPKLIIAKALGTTSSWWVYHTSINSTNTDGYLVLNSTAGTADDATIWTTTAPTSSVFSIGSAISAHDYVAYCFAEKSGFSSFNTYTGNQSAHGPFIYTGFKPAWIMIKNTSDGDDGWIIENNKASAYNPTYNYLVASSSAAEGGAGFPIDFLSNGFKIRGNDISYNQSGYVYAYMAFAEEPLVASNGDPATAR
jgi:hypothetical protein